MMQESEKVRRQEADQEKAHSQEETQEGSKREADCQEPDTRKLKEDQGIWNCQDRKARKRKKDNFRRQEKRISSYGISGSMTVKIIVYFMLVLFCFTSLSGIYFTIDLQTSGAYSSSLESVLLQKMYHASEKEVAVVQYYLTQGDSRKAEEICERLNIDLSLVKEQESGEKKVLWSTWNGYATDMQMVMPTYFNEKVLINPVVLNGSALSPYEEYMFLIYVNPLFTKKDIFKSIATVMPVLYEARYYFIIMATLSPLLGIICFTFLMCGAGHRRGYKEIVPGVLTRMHLDVLIGIFWGMALIFLECAKEMNWGVGSIFYVYSDILVIAYITFGFAAFVVFCMDLAIRVKMGNIWKHSLIYKTLCLLGRMLRFLWRINGLLLKSIPLVALTVIVFLGLCVLEFLGVMIYCRGEGVILWVLEKLLLFPAVLYIALICKKLLKASRALAEGVEDYVVDTSKMFGEFKEHGENLNSLGRGISKAVAERMKSERLKTELITNVSHDLKTPLTSIINYAELLRKETVSHSEENSCIREYAEVLFRQSNRLKKLLEDLLEASKATTGNVEVSLEPCEAGVILSQAAGEYENRMKEKGLLLIARQPEEPVRIMADGRHLWRVFDNLLNNICKYAQENSRVYLSVETKEEYVLIVFRNMSKYPLEVPPEELQERFVRGDKSRHMEGNGLGLSIADSLIQLQKGSMEILTDGDLFKVILRFQRVYE